MRNPQTIRRNLQSLCLFTGIIGVSLLPWQAPAKSIDVVTFDDPDSVRAWRSVNDGVMGGVSKGGFERTDQNTLLFTGDLSLENNGGFASIRTQALDVDLSGVSAIEVRVRGDGRTYWVDLRKQRQMGASSYRAPLSTTRDEWVTTTIPIGDFKFQSFGKQIPSPALDPADVAAIGFMLADKTPGAFQLEIEHVRAVRETAGGGNTIVDVAAAAGTFQTLLAAATAADLAGALAGDGPFTVLAPTDDAFAKLPAGTVDDLLKPENKAKLANILKYHVVAGRVPLARALELKEGATLQGESISVTFENSRVKIGPATLVTADIEASNGIIHVIDQVLLPPERDLSPLSPSALIELAIDRGVPLFNHGNHRACASIYEVTCEALRAMPSLDAESVQELEEALVEMRETTAQREAAWVLRHALDRVYARLASQ